MLYSLNKLFTIPQRIVYLLSVILLTAIIKDLPQVSFVILFGPKRNERNGPVSLALLVPPSQLAAD